MEVLGVRFGKTRLTRIIHERFCCNRQSAALARESQVLYRLEGGQNAWLCYNSNDLWLLMTPNFRGESGVLRFVGADGARGQSPLCQTPQTRGPLAC